MTDSRPLRFLHVCLSSSWGGLEMAVSKWNKLLNENGHSNFNICSIESPLYNDLSEKKYHVSSWPNPSQYFNPSWTLKLRHFIKKHQIDIIMVQNLRDLWLISPALYKMPKVYLIGFAQMMVGIDKRDFLHKKIYGRMNTLCALTKFQRDALLNKIPVPKSKYQILPNFVDTQFFHPKKRNSLKREGWNVTPDDFLIGTVGRLDKQKGQSELIHAFASLTTSFDNLKLLIVGDPTIGEENRGYKQQLIDLIHELKLEEKVLLEGFSKTTDDIYPNLDIFVMPSHQETFGFVLIEAMASGTPVVATQAGGVPEILNEGQFGELCLPKSAENLALSIKKLIEHPEHRDHLKTLARDHVANTFDRNIAYKKLLKIIESFP